MSENTMRVVILTNSQERHYYFGNTVIEGTDSVVGVITSGGTLPPTLRRRLRSYRRLGIWRLVKTKALNLLFRKELARLAAEKEADEARFFGGSRERLMREHGDLLAAHIDAETHGTVNGEYALGVLRSLKPDILVVMGTTLLRQPVLSLAKHALNIHTGLSPYYRGSRTNLWPIIEEDYGYFGVTVHVLSLGIDSGDIIYTARPEVESSDTYGTINSKCIQIGAALMVKAIKKVEAGDLKAVPQWCKGKLFQSYEMNGFVVYQYFKKREAFMARHVDLARKGELPQVRLVGD